MKKVNGKSKIISNFFYLLKTIDLRKIAKILGSPHNKELKLLWSLRC